MTGLVVHRGGWLASRADLAAVAVPEATDSYVPVPYGRFIEEVGLHIPRFGLMIQKEEYALAREGAQMFGVLSITNGHQGQDYALAIGLRSSYDRSIALGLISGSSVFCCDNLAFSGEVEVRRKHTINVFRDLPDLIYQMLSSVSIMRDRQGAEIEAMKGRELTNPQADHLMLEAIRHQVLPASQLPKVMEAWDSPKYEEFQPRNAWSLYNGFTEVMKARSPRAQVEDTLRLSNVFRTELALAER